MLLLYLVLLGAIALLTAYTRNFQRTIVDLGARVDQGAATAMTPRVQWLRTFAVALSWPLAFGLGIMFIAWWKAVALVIGAFLVLVPALGSLTPRSMSAHYRERIRSDLRRRVSRGGPEAGRLRQVLERVEEVETGR